MISFLKTEKKPIFRLILYLKVRIVRTDFPMVPKDRIELSADPYQGPVLPLNYIGKSIKIISKQKKEVNHQLMNI